MDTASYSIVRSGDGWGIKQGHQISGRYATKEAAFEVAVAAASNDIKLGREIRISVAGAADDDPALGTSR